MKSGTGHNSLKAFLNGYRKLPSAAHRQLAEDLYAVFKNFGADLDRMSYSSQTAQMKKLIEALDLPENSRKIETLSLEDAFEDMKSRQDAFEALFAGQAQANADLRMMKSASAIRRDLEKKLKSLLNLSTAMNGVPGWELLYSDTHELVKAAKNSAVKKSKENRQPKNP